MLDSTVSTIPPAPMIEPMTVLAGKYRVEKVLGTGGMGVVVAALHLQLDERVAIKLLRPDRAALPEATERALREARATVKIQSDHVVRVFDAGTLDDGAPYIVMEHLVGCDLAQLLCAEGRLSVDDAASYVRQACDAIAKAHALGIVHRDLKPANLFLAVRDDVACIKVLDFGISKFSADARRLDAALTGGAAVLGSPAYMSPEQLESARDVDGRTDVWSLGVILFELVTGAHPFVGDSLPQLYKRIAEQPAPSITTLRPDAPPALDAVIARCLAKSKAERFPDATALAAALAPLAAKGTSSVGFAATSLAASAKPQFAAGTPTGIERPALPRRRRRIPIAIAAAVGLGAVTTLALYRHDDHAAPPAATPPVAFTVLACPQLRVSGVVEPSGWLGAATASIACTRAQARMGGHSASTRVPAELLALPRTPVDNFPEDPFDPPAARARQIAVARTASAWLDGTVSASDGFRVELVLRGSDDRELGRGTGVDPSLLAATRAAMQPIEPLIPSARAGDPFLVAWFGALTPEAAVALADLFIEANMGDDATQCARVKARTDVTAAEHAVVMRLCASNPTQGPPDSPARDISSPAALRMSLGADPYVDRRPVAEDLARLDAAIAKTTTHEERAFMLAKRASVLEDHHDIDGATDAALASIAEDPKLLDLHRSPWNLLSWLRANSNAAPAANAWVPWSTEAYCFSSTRTQDLDRRVRIGRRDHLLSHDHVWTESLVEFLVADGKIDEARTIVAGAKIDALRVLVDAAEAKFGRAFAIANEALADPSTGEVYATTYVSATASQLALTFDRPAIGADAIFARYLAVEPSPAADNTLVLVMATQACASATRELGTKCLARIRALSGGRVGNIDGILDGAEHFTRGEYAAAALAWRTMMVRPGWQLDSFRDLLGTALERSGQDDLVARLDAPVLASRGRYNGVELAHVRAARRAERSGDKATAKRLAVQVIAAWQVADVDVPAVAEMRKMVTRLR
jgi:serine/threonine-protein kinase